MLASGANHVIKELKLSVLAFYRDLKQEGAGSRAGPGPPMGGAAAAERQAGKRRHIGVGRAVLS